MLIYFEGWWTAVQALCLHSHSGEAEGPEARQWFAYPLLKLCTYTLPLRHTEEETVLVQQMLWWTSPSGRPGDVSPRPPPPCLESQSFQFDPTFLWTSLVLLRSPIAFSVILFSAIGPFTCPLFP